jgi:hypothetical protein
MSIPAVSAIGAGLSSVTPTAYLSAPSGVDGASATGFASALGALR